MTPTLANSLGICIGGMVVGYCLSILPVAHAEPPLSADDVRIVDLTWPLNDKSPFWPGDDYQPFELKTIATLEKDGVLSRTLSMPEHYGTHLDAPNHFEANQRSADEIPPQQLIGPGVVIDISQQAEQDPDTTLSLKQIEAWEKQHGEIPEGGIVLLHSGWGGFWKQPVRYRNQDVRGEMHFPGYSAEAAEFLVERRRVRGVGIDTLSIDRGTSKKFPVHHIVNKAGKYGLENVAHLDRLPARGFTLIVAPLKIENGTGGATRIFALLPRTSDSSQP